MINSPFRNIGSYEPAGFLRNFAQTLWTTNLPPDDLNKVLVLAKEAYAPLEKALDETAFNLRCNICLCVSSDYVLFCCKQDHIICASCKNSSGFKDNFNMFKCPMCKERSIYQHCRVLGSCLQVLDQYLVEECSRCDRRITLAERETHAKQRCIARKEPCPGCHMEIVAADYCGHFEQCPNVSVVEALTDDQPEHSYEIDYSHNTEPYKRFALVKRDRTPEGVQTLAFLIISFNFTEDSLQEPGCLDMEACEILYSDGEVKLNLNIDIKLSIAPRHHHVPIIIPLKFNAIREKNLILRNNQLLPFFAVDTYDDLTFKLIR